MVDSKENYKFDLGVKGLNKTNLHSLLQDRERPGESEVHCTRTQHNDTGQVSKLDLSTWGVWDLDQYRN